MSRRDAATATLQAGDPDYDRAAGGSGHSHRLEVTDRAVALPLLPDILASLRVTGILYVCINVFILLLDAFGTRTRITTLLSTTTT
jgi:hypothetical protein